ncbi:TonB-dependent receptor [Olivibacter sitiensis]|uniref:TonB-dependent receptor n=1 Tax=Olivibacter sitiensis TaxID=376470 RepID=UPI0003FEA9DA|nr:TonB-dependent receptor [Olivibacter sitiensis]
MRIYYIKPKIETFILIGFIFFFCNKSFAQDNLISLSLSDASFKEFINQIEKQSNYKFYYDNTQTDSVLIDLNVEKGRLEDVLDKVLTLHNLFFAIDGHKQVFITKGQGLITALPMFNEVIGTVKDSAAIDLTHISDYKEEDVSLVPIENKLYEIGSRSNIRVGTKLLTGYVTSAVTGLPIALATVNLVGTNIQVQTDRFGYYSISVPEERSVIKVSTVGMKETQRQLIMYSSGRLDIAMNDQVYALNEVIVSAEQGNNVKRTQMGVELLSIKTIKQTPTVLGEADLVKVILTLPGVQTVGEAASGFNVRGGATDQNLVLFNDATIYNPAHFFGFFSAFNADAVSNVELYKGSIPSRYGGRLSSVLDVTAKEGNRSKFSGSGGIGLLTSRLSFDGPIGKKTSYFIGGRSTYSDWLLNLIPDDSYKNSNASFYDVNVQLEHQADERNVIYLTGYSSNDRFSLNSDTSYRYKNANVNVKWKKTFNNELYGIFKVGIDTYNFNVASDENPINAFDLKYNIGQVFLKADIYQHVNDKHNLNYGFNGVGYKLNPGRMAPVGTESDVLLRDLESEQALETALYFSDVYKVNDRFTLDMGVRYSMFNYLGPRRVNYYAPNLPKSETTIIETKDFSSGEPIKTYHAPEFRISARYAFNDNSSVKGAYNSLRQYIHMLSNTTAITPTDTWKLSDAHIKPQFGDQVSLGYYQNFASNIIEASIELYYKRMNNYLDYKSGAQLLLNEAIETDVINTEAKAYGAEFLIKKTSGKLNGWLSYTYSRVQQRTVNVEDADMINNGEFYPSNYDKPHDITLVGNYKFSHRVSFSLNVTYSTGRPITLPIGRYYYAGSERVYYSQRNQYRIPDFFRTDASFNIEGNHKVKKLAHSSWTVGVYNLTGRRNPFSIFYASEGGNLNGYRLSIFGHQIPFVTYNFRF